MKWDQNSLLENSPHILDSGITKKKKKKMLERSILAISTEKHRTRKGA